MDDIIGIPYPLRGIKKEEGWEHEVVTYPEIQELKTPFLSKALLLYNNYKLFGLPHGKGYMKERGVILDVIRIIEDEVNSFDIWEMERKKG